MFICNFKINSNKILKISLILILIFIVLIMGFSIYKIFIGNKFSINDSQKIANVYNIPVNDYTNVLKSVHDDLNTYIGQKINFSGYVYRVYDLNENEFVLARDMVINSNSQTLVVGFLCQYKGAKKFQNGTWVNITGQIIKGYYHGDIPVIDIKEIKEIEKPEDVYVYPPDDFYVPTAALF